MKKTGFYLPKRLYLKEELFFRIESYLMSSGADSGRVAILVETRDHEPYTTLTVNFPYQHLEENEFCVKSWSENEDLVKACYASGMVGPGMFIDTGKKTDDMGSPIWRFSPEIVEYIKMKQEA